jgi:hypothetical protein
LCDFRDLKTFANTQSKEFEKKISFRISNLIKKYPKVRKCGCYREIEGRGY